ncbi:MAG: hypothetical protein NTV32_07350 [Gammaproteobacteria bacterium]|nr:hypothetical protein [Gammaproteobacteria bacterium]
MQASTISRNAIDPMLKRKKPAPTSRVINVSYQAGSHKYLRYSIRVPTSFEKSRPMIYTINFKITEKMKDCEDIKDRVRNDVIAVFQNILKIADNNKPSHQNKYEYLAEQLAPHCIGTPRKAAPYAVLVLWAFDSIWELTSIMAVFDDNLEQSIAEGLPLCEAYEKICPSSKAYPTKEGLESMIDQIRKIRPVSKKKKIKKSIKAEQSSAPLQALRPSAHTFASFSDLKLLAETAGRILRVVSAIPENDACIPGS